MAIQMKFEFHQQQITLKQVSAVLISGDFHYIGLPSLSLTAQVS